MEKILRALLEAKFPTIDVKSLIEIVNATPNPSLAVEILCGLYEPEIIKPQVWKKKYNTSDVDTIYTFISYNKWTDRVSYSYAINDTKSAYFPPETDKSSITLDNFDSFKIPYSSNAISISIPTGKMKEVTDSMSLNSWNILKEYKLSIFDDLD